MPVSFSMELGDVVFKEIGGSMYTAIMEIFPQQRIICVVLGTEFQNRR